MARSHAKWYRQPSGVEGVSKSEAAWREARSTQTHAEVPPQDPGGAPRGIKGDSRSSRMA